MKKRYALHPREFALGETEQFYGNMEKKGWRLDKRGVFFSRFRKDESREMRYRIEVAATEEAVGLPKEQVDIYEECGWEYVTGHGMIHLFRAPKDSEAVEFYMEPEQQAATWKALKHRYLRSLLWPLCYLVILILLGLLVSGTSEWSRWLAQLYIAWVTETAQCMMLLGVILWGMWNAWVGTWHLYGLCKRMKKGIPFEHEPKGRRRISHIVKWCLVLAVVILVILDVTKDRNYDMPLTADGPYLLLSDIGINGERTESFYRDRTSKVKYDRSLLAEYWDCFEVVDIGSCKEVEKWMYQDMYELHESVHIDKFVKNIMRNSAFGRGTDAFRKVEITGLDAAYIAGNLECIAVKDHRVCFITSSFDREAEIREALGQIAERWK